MAVTVANGNLELAAQFLIEGGPVLRMPLPGHVPPEVTRRMASGPGRITTPPNEPPAVYRLVAAAAEIGAADELHAIADLAREDPTALRPLLDRLASTHLPLLRLVCEQPRAFKLMLNPDWRAKAREYARAAVEAREQVVRAVEDRINHAQIAMSRATVEASMASSHGAMAHAHMPRSEEHLQHPVFHTTWGGGEIEVPGFRFRFFERARRSRRQEER